MEFLSVTVYGNAIESLSVTAFITIRKTTADPILALHKEVFPFSYLNGHVLTIRADYYCSQSHSLL